MFVWVENPATPWTNPDLAAGQIAGVALAAENAVLQWAASHLKSFWSCAAIWIAVHLSGLQLQLDQACKVAQGKEPVAAVNGPCALQIYGLLNNQHTLYWSAPGQGYVWHLPRSANAPFCFYRLCAEAVHAVSRPTWGCIPLSRWVISRLDPSIPQLCMEYSQRKWIIQHIFCYLTQRVSLQKKVLFWLGSRAILGYKMETFARTSPTKKHLKFGRLLSDL